MAKNRQKKFSITALAYDKRGRLLSIGRNSYVKTHPIQARYAKLGGKPEAIYLHAEIASLIRARGEVYRMVITRFDSKGLPVLAKPCSACLAALDDYGVEKVEHT